MRPAQPLRAAVAAIAALAVCVTPAVAEAPVPAPAQAPLTIRVGQAESFSRIEFRWAAGAQMGARRDGQVLTISFSRDAKPDLGVLKSVPLKWIKSVDVRHQKGGILFVLTLTDDAGATTGLADGADFVNVFAKQTAVTGPAQAPPSSRPDPVPFGGTVAMTSALAGQQLRFDFPWRNPLGAAVFRRGDAIWIVFDAQAKIDVSKAPKAVVQYAAIQSFQGQGYSAVRITTRAPIAFAAAANGSDWGVILEPFSPPPYTAVTLTRDDSDGPAAMTTAMAGATGVYWVTDPAVGDRIGVVTALAPSKGLPTRRDFVEFAMLQSAQGLAIIPRVDDLQLGFNGDIVSMSRPKGLALSPATTRLAAQALDAPKPAALAGLIGDDWANTGAGSFLTRYDTLMGPVSDEEGKGLEGPTAGHLALARFMIGEGLDFEAIGLLNDAMRTHPALGGEAEFRALRGMAKVMAGRDKEAQTDLAAPVLADNPAASLWRAYVSARQSQWTDARKAFTAGSSSLSQFPPLWRQRFTRAAAETALALGDVAGARSWINYALANIASPEDDARTRLTAAMVTEREGSVAAALGQYQALAASPMDDIAGPAQLHATQLQLTLNTVTPAQAIGVFDGLRFRWRGGSFELDTIRALGQLYLSQGRYREALEAFRSAGKNLPDLPEAVQLQADLEAAFKSLFLDGQADGLQPVQALALFYDFKELTPVGEDGDAMVRRLTRRLVDVDLLPQAEELLKYQVDNRLEGVSKAEVATDLAVIDLMDRKPEDALGAINVSRTTALPNALNLQRRIVAARALTGLGQYPTALEMLGADNSPDAVDARAEIVWRQRNWPAAGAIFEKQLGDRYRTPGALAAVDEGRLLRAAAAYSLAGDDAALARLRANWTPFVAGARNPDALRVALSGLNNGQVSPTDFSRIAADNQLFQGWVAKMKSRFDAAPLPSPRPPPSARQAAADAAPAPAAGKPAAKQG